MQGAVTAGRAENGAFRVEDGRREERRKPAIKNRKLRHDSEREHTERNSGCCS